MKKWISLILTAVLMLSLTPAVRAVRPDIPDTLEAFLDYLQPSREDIASHEEQLLMSGWVRHGSIYFEDLNGDRLPEMVFCRPIPEQNVDLTAGMDLEILLVSGAEACAVIQSPPIPVGIGGGHNYALFRTEDGLLLATMFGDIGGSGLTFDRIWWDGESFRMERILEMESKAHEDFLAYDTVFRENGGEISEDSYQKREAELLASVKFCILSNSASYWGEDGDPVCTLAAGKNKALTAEQAEQYIALHQEFPPIGSKQERELLEALGGRQYVFASGAGGWGDSLELAPDGSFTGLYSDSNMGEEDPELGTLGTEYYCSYHGSLQQVRKVGDHCYWVSLEAEVEDPQGKVEVIDRDTKRIYTGLVGLADTDALLIYTPGQPMEETPENLQVWASPITGGAEILPYPVIYNPIADAPYFCVEDGIEIPVFAEVPDAEETVSQETEQPDSESPKPHDSGKPEQSGENWESDIFWEIDGQVDVEVLQQDTVIGGFRGEEAADDAAGLDMWLEEDTLVLQVPSDSSLRITPQHSGVISVRAHTLDRRGNERCIASFTEVKVRKNQPLETEFHGEEWVLRRLEDGEIIHRDAGTQWILWLIVGMVGLLLILVIVLLVLVISARKKKGKFS